MLGLLLSGPLSAQAEPAASLEGTSWQLVKLQSYGSQVLKPTNPGDYTLRFRSENRLVVESDCNRGGATWKQDGQALNFAGFGVSQALCNPGTLHNYYAAALSTVQNVEYREGHLILNTASSGVYLEFEPLDFNPR